MKTTTLKLRWDKAEPQSFTFENADAAIESAAAIFKRFGLEPYQSDWRGLMARGGRVIAPSLAITMIEAEVHDGALTDEAIPDPVAEADPIYNYVLMRKDVPDYLSGKAQAQSNHAGTALVIRGYRKNDEALTARINEWASEADGFGTCIVKMVTAAEMRQAVSLATLLGLHAGLVNDPSYPLRDGDKMAFLPIDTCAFVFGRVSECNPVVRRFPLLKEEWEK